MLAGTVGALGSLLVSGGAFGIWHLLRNRKGGGDVFGRSISNMSDDSIQSRGRDGKEPPPPYGDQNQGLEPDTENTAKPPNIYRASMYDEINPWGPKLQRHA